MASKIPQSEWDAIALRREKGETVAAIAQSYGCSTASIYAILKRSKDGAPEAEAAPEAELPLAPPPVPVAQPVAMPAEAPVHVPVAETPKSETPHPAPAPTRAEPLTLGAAAPRPERPPQHERQGQERPGQERQGQERGRPDRFGRPERPERQDRPERPQGNRFEGGRPEGNRGPVESQERAPRPVEQHQQRAPLRVAAETPAPIPQQAAPMPLALTAQIDADLRAQAEAAIEAFRQTFDAALASADSAEARQQLHQAASDLMRVAARTTIVLARMEANIGRTPLPPFRPRHEPATEGQPQPSKFNAQFQPRRR